MLFEDTGAQEKWLCINKPIVIYVVPCSYSNYTNPLQLTHSIYLDIYIYITPKYHPNIAVIVNYIIYITCNYAVNDPILI